MAFWVVLLLNVAVFVIIFGDFVYVIIISKVKSNIVNLVQAKKQKMRKKKI